MISHLKTYNNIGVINCYVNTNVNKLNRRHDKFQSPFNEKKNAKNCRYFYMRVC